MFIGMYERHPVMFNEDTGSQVNSTGYAKDKFCMHMIQIHAAGRIRQFADDMSMDVLELFEKHLSEWPKLDGYDKAVSATSEFLNATLYGEAVDAFRQIVPEVMTANTAVIDGLAHALANLDGNLLRALKHTLDELIKNDMDYGRCDNDQVSIGTFLRSLTLGERETLGKILEYTDTEHVEHLLNGMTDKYRFTLRGILRNVTNEMIRKNTDAQTAEGLIRLNSRIHRIEYAGHGSETVSKSEIDTIIAALDSPHSREH